MNLAAHLFCLVSFLLHELIFSLLQLLHLVLVASGLVLETVSLYGEGERERERERGREREGGRERERERERKREREKERGEGEMNKRQSRQSEASFLTSPSSLAFSASAICSFVLYSLTIRVLTSETEREDKMKTVPTDKENQYRFHFVLV